MASELNKREEKAQNEENEFVVWSSETAINKMYISPKFHLTLAHVRSILPRIVPLTFNRLRLLAKSQHTTIEQGK